MTQGGLTRQLVAVSRRMMARIPASMGHFMIGASAMMGAVTGSSVAAVAAMGRALGPEMLQRGYKPGYVGALNASAGLLGVPIPLILYGSAVSASITQLFLATLLPGLMFLVAIMAVHALRARHVLADGVEQEALSSAATRTFRGEFLSALPALFMPLLVLGGIYTGIFTPTEAAGVAAIYALLYIIVSRSAGSHQLSEAFVRAAISAAAVMFIIGFTTIFSRALTLEQIPQDLANFAIGLTQNPLMFLLLVSLVLLVVGMFMETSAAVLLMGPLLAPAASQYGIDPIHFGIIVVINIEIRLLTPPLAANLYVASLTNRIPIMALLRQIGWFLLACLIMLVAITYVPGIALWYHILPGY